MSGLTGEIAAEARQFLEESATYVERSIRRSTTVDLDGWDVDIEQTKYILPEEMALVRAQGALALASTEWFQDVGWRQHPGREARGWRDLHLEATYPLDYFVEQPRGGSYIGREDNMRWLDQYGAISGFGNGDVINLFLLRFVTLNSRTITELRYPDDPTALDQYNERYRQYMQTLDDVDPMISYYRGWGSHNRDKAPLIIGGYTLAGIGINEVLHRGSAPVEDNVDGTRVVLHYEPEQDGYVSRDVTIVGDEAMTEPYWDGEDDREPASEELLETTLELVKRAA